MDLVRSPAESIERYTGSILDINDVNQAVRGCNAVVHLAAMLGVRRTEIKKMETLNINIQGTINILEACVKERVERIVFASSSEVYGRQKNMPLSEETAVSPISIYAVTKLAAEEYVKAYCQSYGLKYSIVRFFNIYGPGQVAEFVIPRFVKAVMEDKSPLVYGRGKQVRSFCYVDDAVEAVAKILLSDKADAEIFNIGNDTEVISIEELALKVISLSKKDLKPHFISMDKADRNEEREISKRVPDIAKAKRLLGFKPKVTLQEGIKKVIQQGRIIETWFDPLERA
jgi:UDP-glucose 4-epimerase